MFENLDMDQLMQAVEDGMDTAGKGIGVANQALTLVEKIKGLFKKKTKDGDAATGKGAVAAADGDEPDPSGDGLHESGAQEHQERLGELEMLAARQGEDIEALRDALVQMGDAVEMLAQAVIKNGDAIIKNGDAIISLSEASKTNSAAIIKNGDAIITLSETTIATAGAIVDHAGRIGAMRSVIARAEETIRRIDGKTGRPQVRTEGDQDI